jgi:3,4-dihydroxy 2-butanone 4-phosphate synthase/GTP cyclohydrolase II
MTLELPDALESAQQSTPPGESWPNSELAEALDCIRRGQVVRVVSNAQACESESPDTMGHLVLAAQRASPEALSRLFQFGDAVPVFATTRDRLELLQIVGLPIAEEPNGDAGHARGANNDSAGERPTVAQLTLAAASLAGSDPALAQGALGAFSVRCVDWGGVVNCQRVYEAAVDLSRMAGLVPAALVSRPGGNPSQAIDPAIRQELCALPTVVIRQLVDHRRAQATSTLLRSGPRVRMPTRHGNFMLQAYEDTLTGQVHLALWTGDLREPTLTRVHSECLTGDLLGSLRCDCGPQLEGALARLAREGSGVLLYLRQEGRGIGLINKLRTYDIQDRGFDTVEANEQIGFGADLRDYSLAAQMLVDLGVSTIRLLTNNPQKVRGLKKHGISIADRVPLVVEPCAENVAYLDVKRKKLGHWLS